MTTTRTRDELAALGKKKLEAYRLRKAQMQAGEGAETEAEAENGIADRFAVDGSRGGGGGGGGREEGHEEREGASERREASVQELGMFAPPLPPAATQGDDSDRTEDAAVDEDVGFFDVLATAATVETVETVVTEARVAEPAVSATVSTMAMAGVSGYEEDSLVVKKASFDAKKFMVMAPASSPAVSVAASLPRSSVDVDVGKSEEKDGKDEGDREDPGPPAPAALDDDQTRAAARSANSARQNTFRDLQEHIDSLTTQNMDLNLCLSQQTTMVQRLTEENEGLVKKLNDASRENERSQAQIRAEREERGVLGVRWKEMEGAMGRVERENRELVSKVKVLGGELLGLEEKLLRERNERLKLISMSGAGSSRAGSAGFHAAGEEGAAALRRELEEVSGALRRVQAEKSGMEQEMEARMQRIQALQKRAEEAEAAAGAAVRALEEARQEFAARQAAPSYPIPHSVVLSAGPMQAFGEQGEGGEEEETWGKIDGLPAEVRALLPMKTWIPSMDEQQTMQNDVIEAIGRFYARIEGLKRAGVAEKVEDKVEDKVEEKVELY